MCQEPENQKDVLASIHYKDLYSMLSHHYFGEMGYDLKEKYLFIIFEVNIKISDSVIMLPNILY